jgi:hypothetical protein
MLNSPCLHVQIPGGAKMTFLKDSGKNEWLSGVEWNSELNKYFL